MNFREGFVMGLLEIRTHKLRSFLSFLGVMVGVASVLLTLSFLRGMQEKMRRGIELSGPGRMQIDHKRMDDAEIQRQGGRREFLTLEDARAIRRQFPELAMVSAEGETWTNFVFQDIRDDVGVKGVTPEFRKRDWIYALRGRVFDESDMARAARVCVLIQKGEPGKKSWWKKYYADYMRDPIDKVFQRYDPLGREILLYNRLFTVVGVLREPNEDDDPRWFRWGDWHRIYVPLTTFKKYIDTDEPEQVESVEVDTGSEATTAFHTDQIRRLLAVRHRGQSGFFTIRNRAEMMQESMKDNRMMGYVFLIVGAISLLAGGIGIMNVSLAVVYSRIREIGIRRAVGATRLDILVQFVLESMLLSFLGGLGGVVLGGVGVWQVPKYAKDVDALVTPGIVLLCLGISVAVGLFFSIYPAWQAAKLDPVEALRYE